MQMLPSRVCFHRLSQHFTLMRWGCVNAAQRLRLETVCQPEHQLRQLSAKGGSFPRWQGKITVQEMKDGYQLLFDDRSLRTPGRHPLRLPNAALALGVAAEWQWQDSGKIRPSTMPLMSLAATAIDQPKDRGLVIDTLLGWLHADAACCREATGPVSARQAEVYNPIVRWARQALQADFVVSQSIFGAPQPAETVDAIRQYLEGLSSWELTATEQLVAVSRSVIVGLAASQEQLTVEQTFQAARLEEDFQIDGWGLVEGGHDVDTANVKVRVAAPYVFLRLLRHK